MRRECSTPGRDEKWIQNFGSKNLKRRWHSEEPGEDEGITLE